MAEYGSSGVWRIADPARPGRFGHGMVELSAFDLPDALVARFTAWITRYEDENLAGDLDTEAFNAEGLALAVALWTHLGPESHVEFQGEASNGGLLGSIVIDAEVAGR